MALRKEYPIPKFKVASYKSPGIRLSFEDTTTLLPEGGGRGVGRIATATATLFGLVIGNQTSKIV